MKAMPPCFLKNVIVSHSRKASAGLYSYVEGTNYLQGCPVLFYKSYLPSVFLIPQGESITSCVVNLDHPVLITFSYQIPPYDEMFSVPLPLSWSRIRIQTIKDA